MYKYRHRETYKDIPIDIRANTTDELIEKVKKKKEQIDRRTIDSNTHLGDFCRMYIDTYKKGSVSPAWYRDLNYFANKMVGEIGNRPIGRIKPIEVQRYLNSCTDYADSTVKKIYDLANQIFRYAYKNGATTYQFDLERPRGNKPHPGRSLSAKEQNVLLSLLNGHRGEILIKIMFFCGLRPGEVAALVWKDIDLDNRIINVNKAVKKNGTVGAPKSAAGVRKVPIPMELMSVLIQHRKSPFSLVCEQKNGYHTKSSLRKLWLSVLDQLNEELGYDTGYRLYDIRHTYCTNLEKQGVPINIASRLMGHSDISVTSRIYTHASDEAIEIALNCIDGGQTHGQKSL